MGMIIPTDLAWAAGFIDGEGTISLRLHVNTQGNTYIYPTLQAANTNVEMLQELRYMFGGSIHAVKQVDGRKRVHRWTCGSRQSVEAIRLLLPYLKLKRPQAALVLEAAAFRDDRETHRMSQKQWNQQLLLMAQVKMLNRRGQVADAG
jgi:hypothetical protein